MDKSPQDPREMSINILKNLGSNIEEKLKISFTIDTYKENRNFFEVAENIFYWTRSGAMQENDLESKVSAFSMFKVNCKIGNESHLNQIGSDFYNFLGSLSDDSTQQLIIDVISNIKAATKQEFNIKLYEERIKLMRERCSGKIKEDPAKEMNNSMNQQNEFKIHWRFPAIPDQEL
jgi:hypothetical protein